MFFFRLCCYLMSYLRDVVAICKALPLSIEAGLSALPRNFDSHKSGRKLFLSYIVLSHNEGV